MEPLIKRAKSDDNKDRGAQLLALKTDVTPQIKNAINWLRSSALYVMPLRMLGSNAAHSSGGMAFPYAYCDLKHAGVAYKFGSLFQPGLRVLEDYISDDTKLPESEDERLLLLRLLEYLNNKEVHKALFKIPDDYNEAEVTAVFAEHLLSQLGISKGYIMDRGRPNSGPKTCPCLYECRTSVIDRYGDTSMGNDETWHGSVDVILKNEEIVVHYIDCMEEQEDDDSPDGKTVVEVKLDSASDPESVYSQMVAETVVFAFIQRKRHPNSSSVLIPSIGISKNELCFFFYNAEEDVLLKSNNQPMGRANFPYCVIALWLVINYKYFCSGLSAVKVPKSGFFEIAKDKIEMYRNKLQLGNMAIGLKHLELLSTPEEVVNIIVLDPDLHQIHSPKK